MSYSKLIILLLAITLCSCTADNAEKLYPTNDVEASLYYTTTLKSIIDSKCISCHHYHTEGANRYDTYEKTKSNISQMLGRINATSNIVMPPAESTQLTTEEKLAFTEFFNILNADSDEENQPIEISWTAYKYPDFDNRSPVSGTFDLITKATLNQNATTTLDILKNAVVEVNAWSVNVGNEPERTQNVLSFFKLFSNTITGTINSYNSENAIIAFKMNGIEQESDFAITIDEDVLILDGKIENMNIFNWQSAYNVLDDICGDYHENKVWEDIDITIKIMTN